MHGLKKKTKKKKEQRENIAVKMTFHDGQESMETAVQEVRG